MQERKLGRLMRMLMAADFRQAELDLPLGVATKAITSTEASAVSTQDYITLRSMQSKQRTHAIGAKGMTIQTKP